MDLFTLGMIVGIGLATVIMTALEAMDRRYQWVEALVEWIRRHLPEDPKNPDG